MYQGQVSILLLLVVGLLGGFKLFAAGTFQEYDHVFDIELDEGGPTMRKLKLPYNKDSQFINTTANTIVMPLLQ